ncbi:MAG: DUF4125 family protein [Desulfovibrio sp.]|nr:DUF4125 family protein [Desulfovibrio sp.]
MTEKERQDLLDEIVKRELEMFLATPNEGGPAECQQRPEAFRLMRLMTHSAHDDEFLRSYLKDLDEAKRVGRNFMIEKYARMDNLIPPLNESPLLDEISKAETDWIDEAAALYPDIIKREGSERFRHYLRCELETLSDETLALYDDEIKRAMSQNRNMALERHNWLAQKLGRPPLKKSAS